MIPKKIHYCWFGGNPLPELAQKCIASWKKFCPDYEIIRWDESNFDVNCCAYVREAYEAKKWAFVTDYVRLYVLFEFGGVYMDTDCELLKPINDFLRYDTVSGFESKNYIPTALWGSIAHAPILEELMRDYDDAHFLKADGSLDRTPNVVRITDSLLKHGLCLNNTLQTIAGFTLFPKEYFCPKVYSTGELRITPNTVCIHHFDGSWTSDENKFMNALRLKLSKIMPLLWANRAAKTIARLKYRGVSGIIQTFKKRKHSR